MDAPPKTPPPNPMRAMTPRSAARLRTAPQPQAPAEGPMGDGQMQWSWTDMDKWYNQAQSGNLTAVSDPHAKANEKAATPTLPAACTQLDENDERKRVGPTGEAQRRPPPKAPKVAKAPRQTIPNATTALPRPLQTQETQETLADSLARAVMEKCKESLAEIVRDAIAGMIPAHGKGAQKESGERAEEQTLLGTMASQSTAERTCVDDNDDKMTTPQSPNMDCAEDELEHRQSAPPLNARTPWEMAEEGDMRRYTRETNAPALSLPPMQPPWGGEATRKILQSGQWTTAAAALEGRSNPLNPHPYSHGTAATAATPMARRENPSGAGARAPRSKVAPGWRPEYETGMATAPTRGRDEDEEPYPFDWTKTGEIPQARAHPIPGNPTNASMTAEQIWEARLDVIETMGLTPVPEGGFPKTQFRSSKDLTRCLHPASVAKWKAAEPGTAIIIDVYGQDNIPNQKAEDTHANIVHVITMATGMPKVDVEAPPRAGPGVRKWDAGTAWLATGLWKGAAELLVRLRVISTDDVTLVVYARAEEPQRYLTALTGFTNWDNAEIRQKVMDALKTDPAYTSIKTMVSTHPNYQKYRDYIEATMRAISTVKIEVRQVATKTGSMPAAFVYMDPPTLNAAHWETWRSGLLAHVFPNLSGRVKPMQRDLRCEGCHGADHQTHQCPLNANDIPGWKGTIAPRPNYFHEITMASAAGYVDHPRSPGPSTAAQTSAMPQIAELWTQEWTGRNEKTKQELRRKPTPKPTSRRG
ncbi:hypothetical protein C2E23DRAFT_890234 [Lenzites betulinus]|nr:hypothetical protein C2E23DRAFT_890234 [Lenzites betulinus]